MKSRTLVSRFRLVPLTIFAAAILFGIKLGEVMDLGMSAIGVPVAFAAALDDDLTNRGSGW